MLSRAELRRRFGLTQPNKATSWVWQYHSRYIQNAHSADWLQNRKEYAACELCIQAELLKNVEGVTDKKILDTNQIKIGEKSSTDKLLQHTSRGCCV